MKWVKGEDKGEFWFKMPNITFCIFHPDRFTHKFSIAIYYKRRKPRFLDGFPLKKAKEIVKAIMRYEKLIK